MYKTISRILLLIFLLIVFLIIASYTKKHAENKKKAMLYTEGLKVVYDKDNFFCPEAQLAFWDSVLALPGNDEHRFLFAKFLKANVLLNLGEENKAIELLQELVERSGKNNNDKFSIQCKTYLALAYLRSGEKNNCVANHSSGSCIFPIQGNGVYMDPAASQKAIEIYREILQNDSNDLASRWLLNIAYMTIGEYPKKVDPEFLIKGLDEDTSAYKVNAFQDMAGSLKLNGSKNMAGGTIIDDFNNDGYLDIVTSSWGLEQSMHYFRNNADGTFTDLSNESGLNNIKGGLNIIQADYNNDGYTDILVLRGAWLGEYGKQPKTLLRNNGDGTFTDVTIESGLLSFHPTQTATWADFNNDGWLDLFIGNETSSSDHPHPSELYINNQDGTFTNVTNEAGCGQTGFMKGVTSADYNNDGWPDIFISTLSGRKILLKNKGVRSKIPQFENATHEAGLDKDSTYTFPTWFWDYDNDGWPDIFVCGYAYSSTLATTAAAEALSKPLGEVSKMYLYRNNHDGTFTNVSKDAGLDRPVFAMGANFGDIDNDGWLDMYLGTGNPDFRSLVPNRMFKNIGGKKFADVTSSARVGNLQKGHGVAFADLDNDGDQDIFIETGGAFKGDAYYNSLYVNPGQNNNNWISILLEGVHSNRSAIGAHIVVSFTEDGKRRTVYSDVNSGGSFGASPLRKEIGIGSAKVIDELIIKWPTTGNVQVFKNVKPCQFLKIKEGSDDVEKINLRLLKFNAQNGSMNMVDCAPVKH
jgi:tetratricopeptide (TPR) repeat protein